MNRQFPIYTQKPECKDCSKCIRHCPVKAIAIRDAAASILPERCIACGQCVVICPSESKVVRSDVARCQALLSRNSKTVLSVAPSWVAEYPEWSWEQLCDAAKAIGFYAVSETALGAQEVSRQLHQLLENIQPGLYISSACPVAVEYITKYHPNWRGAILPVASPLLLHTRIIHQQYGSDAAVVFLGPCIGKKLEADRSHGEIKLALTFPEFAELRQQAEQNTEEVSNEPSMPDMLPPAGVSRVYPREGGMIQTLLEEEKLDVQCYCASGLEEIRAYLEPLESPTDSVVFLEVLACKGGCINGPCLSQRVSRLTAQKRITDFAQGRLTSHRREWDSLDNDMEIPSASLPRRRFSSKQIQDALLTVGKLTPSDELNCGGCGYSTCRDFACALLETTAEPDMCVSFMRNRATKKANALLETTPSAVVIVNKQLEIIEANRPFIELFGPDLNTIQESLGSLAGAHITSILNCPKLFELALQDGRRQQKYRFRQDGRDLTIQLFTIEPGEVVGAIVKENLDEALQREEIGNNAEKVLHKSLQTVQNIACQLGEYMAETEILLRSIASYSPTSQIDPPLEPPDVS